MTERRALSRLRTALHLLAMGLFAGTIVELLSVQHYAGWLQKLPFALCLLGLVALVLLWWRPTPGAILAIRGLMILTSLGSLLGVYEHVRGNYAFAREVQPQAGTWDLLREAFHGRDPLLAPAALALGAALTIAATYATAALVASERWAAFGRRRDQAVDWSSWSRVR
jgi:hypothetical protein